MQRVIGLDLHKDTATFTMLAPDGTRLEAGTFAVTNEDVDRFAGTLTRDDTIVLEASANAWAFHDRLAAKAGEVAIANPLKVHLIAQAHLKTDSVDATTLAQLKRTNFLPEVWIPDANTRRWRSLLSHRELLTKTRTGWKNRVHAILMRSLIKEPACSDLFGSTGRRWLSSLELPAAEQLQIASALRMHDAVKAEQEALEQVLAQEAQKHPALPKLLAVPGLNLYTGMTLLAAIGDVRRFPDAKRLVGYLGLCPRVHQSGPTCYQGRITKAGSSSARWMTVQAANQFVRSSSSPIQGWYQRLKARKGHNRAIIAVARKLVVLVWHLLTKSEGYRYVQPSRHKFKLDQLRWRARGKRHAFGPPKGTPPSPQARAATRARWEAFRAAKKAASLAATPPSEC